MGLVSPPVGICRIKVPEDLLNLKARLNQILADHSGKTVKQVEKATDRDNFLSAQEAVDFGLVDKLIAP